MNEWNECRLKPLSSGHSSLSGWWNTKEWSGCTQWLAWDFIPGAASSPEQAFHLFLLYQCQLFCLLKLGGTTFNTNAGKGTSSFISPLLFNSLYIISQLPSPWNDEDDSELAHFNTHLHIPISPGCSNPYSPLVIKSSKFIFLIK